MAEKSREKTGSITSGSDGNGFRCDNRKTEHGGSESTYGKDYHGEIPEHMPKAEIAKDRLRFWISLMIFIVFAFIIIRLILSFFM